MQQCLLKLPPLKQKEKEDQEGKKKRGVGGEAFLILLNSVGKFMCVPSTQTKLSSFSSVTLPGFRAEAAY